MNLATRIQAHPARADRVRALRFNLRRTDPDTIPVTWDPEPDAEPNSWRTARLAWLELAAEPCSHGLVIQDDMIPCRRFLVAAARAIRARPRRVIGFWHNSKATEQAAERGESWAPVKGYLSGHCIAMPRAMIEPFVAFADQPDPGHWQYSYDSRLKDFLREIDEPIFFTVPSLVEHGAPSDSLLGHNNKTRVARWYIGEENPLAINWSKGPK